MKVAVITRHAIVNYGSLLQAFATQKAIEKIGHSCQIINYIRKDESSKEFNNTFLKSNPKRNKTKFNRFLYKVIKNPGSKIAGKRFEVERKNLLNLSKLYESKEELISDPPIADVYCTGSDQVWGPVMNGTYDDNYFLSFLTGKKISFASSFGKIPSEGSLDDFFRTRLSNYSFLTVRENYAVDYLKRIGINATQALDPTLLFDSNFWDTYSKKIKHKHFVLIYQIHDDKRLGEYAKQIARKKKLKLIRISPFLHHALRNGKFVWCTDVFEFLSYLKNAEYVITDSFHGTAFSINFNKNFVEFLPDDGTSGRNISILELTGLKNRIITDFDYSLVDENIDFTYANNILKTKRIESFKILNQIIERK